MMLYLEICRENITDSKKYEDKLENFGKSFQLLQIVIMLNEKMYQDLY